MKTNITSTASEDLKYSFAFGGEKRSREIQNTKAHPQAPSGRSRGRLGVTKSRVFLRGGGGLRRACLELRPRGEVFCRRAAR